MQLLINSLVTGSIYALVASGFSLIYKSNKFFHFAHGAIVAFCGYIFYFLFSSLRFNFILSILFSLIFSGLIGAFFFYGLFSPLRKKNSSKLVLLLISVALMIVLQNIILLLFGANTKLISLNSQKVFIFLGATITSVEIWIIGISILLFFILSYIISKTKFGRNIRAISDSNELSEIVGINANKTLAGAFILSSIIAGVAGILIGIEQNLNSIMGTMLSIKGFIGAVIGGIASVPGAIIGSYILGFIENFGTWYLSSGYKDLISFVVLFLFLLLKPEGLFGGKKAR